MVNGNVRMFGAQMYPYGWHGLRKALASRLMRRNENTTPKTRATTRTQQRGNSALLHPKGAGMSDRQIADHVGVSNTFVGKCRVELKKDGHLSTDDTCRTGKDGKVYDTTNIGKTAACPHCGATANRLQSDGDCHFVTVAKAKAEALIEKMEAEAKERMKAGGGDHKSKDAKSGPVNLPEAIKGDTRDRLGKIAGVSGSMIDRARKVRSKGTPELAKAVEEGRRIVANWQHEINHPHYA